jgi:hypothetical protein
VWFDRRLLTSLVRIAVVTGALPARAQELQPQEPKQQGGYVVPMLSLRESFDDNLFLSARPQSDFVTRASVGVQAGHRSAPFAVDAILSQAGDRFARHPSLNSSRARAHGQLALRYSPSRRLSLNGTAVYLETQTPTELNEVTGLAVGRLPGTRVAALPWLEYRLGEFTSAMASWSLSHDTLDGRVNDTHALAASLERRVSRTSGLQLRYERRHYHFLGEFGFPGPGNAVVMEFVDERSRSDVATLGFTRELDERTLLLLRAGPRFSQGRVAPELLVTLKRRVPHGRLDVAWSKGQATALGRLGVLETHSLVALYRARAGQALEIAVGPGLYRNTLDGRPLAALRLNLETLWRFTDQLHLGAQYGFDLQQPDFGAPGHLRRGVLHVRLIASPPQRRPLPPEEQDAQDAPQTPSDGRE